MQLVTDGPHLSTPRLLLRPWATEEAPVMRELWTERDPRVPPHRRIDADGRPTVEDIRSRIRRGADGSFGLLAIEERVSGDVLGYCGLVAASCGGEGEREIAFELLRRVHGRGFATEAAAAVVGRARDDGHRQLWATVWDWNVASRRVLEKLGFEEVGVAAVVAGRGTSLITHLPLHPPGRSVTAERLRRVAAPRIPVRSAACAGRCWRPGDYA